MGTAVSVYEFFRVRAAPVLFEKGSPLIWEQDNFFRWDWFCQYLQFLDFDMNCFKEESLFMMLYTQGGVSLNDLKSMDFIEYNNLLIRCKEESEKDSKK
jgi:hypothetical protein